MAMEDQEGPGEKLKGDSFGPPDVVALGVPVFEEGPRTPIFSHNDAKAHSGAYIWECIVVVEDDRPRYWVQGLKWWGVKFSDENL
jgi:hypothetical protein